jgi:hypothetical protein
MIDEAVWNIFLRGPSVMTQEEIAAQPPSPDIDLIGKLQWDTMYSSELKSKGQFKEITKHIVENWRDWQAWMSTEDPYSTPVPGAPSGSEVGCYQE